MNGLELISPMGAVKVKIGQHIDELRSFFNKVETTKTYRDDAGLNQQDLFYREQGIAFSFVDKSLIAVFLYIKADNVTPFTGSFGCLDKEFFLNSSLKKFYNLTISNSYVEWFKDYPMSTDMIKSARRLRYMDNPRTSKILINYSDLTILLRKPVIPAVKNELLPLMMQRLEKAISIYDLNQVNIAEYERNCTNMINKLNEEIV